MSTVFRVAYDNIAPLWPQVAPLVERGLRGTPTHTVEDVRRALYSGSCQLWAQCDMPVVEAIVITEFVPYPQGLWLRAWIGATDANGPGMDHDDLFRVISKWARDQHCRGFEAIGRHGWLRHYPTAQVEGLYMRVSLEDGGNVL